MSKHPDTVAAVDLGSNSFHMIVARVTDGDLKILDRLRQMVRLAAGLDAKRRLSKDAQARALECLRMFGQRLKDMPVGSVRIVGTNTLRSAQNAAAFLRAAEEALGHPIEVISGVEEARLIYLGVAHSLAASDARRLVVDIGGGSTELIVGERFEPLHLESLYMGCVSISRTFFDKGSITRKRLRKAELAARMELEPVEKRFRKLGWKEVIGASGTIRAVEAVVRGAGWSDDGITPEALRRLQDAMLDAGSAEQLKLSGLDAERAPVFPGGVVVLSSVFQALGIERMHVADGALREGLLYDLLGRIRHEDVRARSVAALTARYHVPVNQAGRVRTTVLALAGQLTQDWAPGEAELQLLVWGADLHEIGLDIAHSQYHKHGAYIVEHCDLSGFSRTEQHLLAFLIRAHRRKFPGSDLAELPERHHTLAQRLAVLLRLAVVLNRSRGKTPLPDVGLRASKATVKLEFPEAWLAEHPLTKSDLEQEATYLQAAGVALEN